jgi:hypothetical protein
MSLVITSQPNAELQPSPYPYVDDFPTPSALLTALPKMVTMFRPAAQLLASREWPTFTNLKSVTYADEEKQRAKCVAHNVDLRLLEGVSCSIQVGRLSVSTTRISQSLRYTQSLQRQSRELTTPKLASTFASLYSDTARSQLHQMLTPPPSPMRSPQDTDEYIIVIIDRSSGSTQVDDRHEPVLGRDQDGSGTWGGLSSILKDRKAKVSTIFTSFESGPRNLPEYRFRKLQEVVCWT